MEYYYPQLPPPAQGAFVPYHRSVACLWTDGVRVCQRRLGSIRDVVEHVTVDHIESTLRCSWLGCPRAGQAFKAKYKLINHLRVHTGERAVRLPFLRESLRPLGEPQDSSAHPHR
ncbi:ZIC2 [Cordylochernes scorpioides]|uniref:ZIC2 n=1 Tax=Cordylochernes scorpioides TaxID=51811 RepID=A0ABY6K5J6_9ARAC|nr:ZIC2 [Cordylochernes scorpioides]